MSLARELTAAIAVFGAGVALGVLARLSLGLLARLGEEAMWWWQLWMRLARLVRGAGLALAMVAAGGWAIRRWFPTVRAELDVVLIAVAGGFVVLVRELDRSHERHIGDRPSGAALVQRPAEEPPQRH